MMIKLIFTTTTNQEKSKRVIVEIHTLEKVSDNILITGDEDQAALPEYGKLSESSVELNEHLSIREIVFHRRRVIKQHRWNVGLAANIVLSQMVYLTSLVGFK